MKRQLLFMFITVLALSLHAQPPTVTIDRVSYSILEQEGYAIASNPLEELQNASNEDIIIHKAVEYNGTVYPVTHFWSYQTAGEGQKICLPEGLIEVRGYSPNAIFETIPLSIERVLNEAFYDNILPQELYLPNIKAVGPMTFYCDGLETLRLGSSLEVVGTILLEAP